MRVFVDLFSQWLIFYQVPFTHQNGILVRHRRAIFRNKWQNVFARFFSVCFVGPTNLSLKLTSERVLSKSLSG